MKTQPHVAQRTLSRHRLRRDLERCTWGVFGVKRDGALYVQASSSHYDERGAIAYATYLAGLNPGRAWVAAPLGDAASRQATRSECA